MKKKLKLPNKFLVRVLLLVVGLFCIALANGLTTKFGLGVAPAAAIPFVLSEATPLSMGITTIVVNALLVFMQIAVLRKKFQPIQLLQLLLVVVFGSFTDWTLGLIDGLVVTGYPAQILCTLISCALMAFGVFLEVVVGLIPLPADGLAAAVVQVTKMDFGIAKNIIDGTQVVVAGICSFVMLHSFVGLREGTVIAAILVGMLIHVYNRYFAFLHRWLNLERYEYDIAALAGLSPKAEALVDSPKEDIVRIEEHPSSFPYIITIDREYGSRGYEIGKNIAEKLGIPFYSYEGIKEVAVENGASEQMISKIESNLPNGTIQGYYGNTFRASRNVRMQSELFKLESRTMRDIANRPDSCVIVAPLVNHILSPHPNCFHVFVSGSYEFRANYLMKEYGYTKAKAMHIVRREDLARNAYCMHFTGSPWGLSRHFTMTVDSSIYGVDAATELVMESFKTWQQA